ncbi:GreA/GreB family elongation factor [Patescibacteria group bacterium]|nr:GreA/GreB family elongation factor [Patescibacteria group bacterium]
MRVPTRKSENYARPKRDPFITQNKFNELQTKLEKIKKSLPALIEEVQRLAQMGDFSENVPYQMAKGKLRGLNRRILEIEDQLKHSQIIELPQDAGKVSVGHFVTIEINGKRKKYQILGSEETNPSLGIISRNSPLGSALLGRRAGETFELRLAGKIVECKIIEIE